MKKDDLHPKIQTSAEKGKQAPFENTWFVIPLPPPQEAPAIANIKLLAEANGILQAMPRPETLTNLDHLILSLFVKREALSSSRMEGTWSTIDHVLTPGEVYDKKEKSGRASILGYAHALEEVFDQVQAQGRQIFTTELVCSLHSRIMSEDPDYSGTPGILRSEEKPPRYVTIGGFPRVEKSTYNPTPPLEVPEKLEETLAWMRDDVLADMGNAGMGMSLLVRMAIAHVHFEAVHPFRDGNGRVGRMLMLLQMIAEGFSPLYLSNFVEMQKNQYGEVLGQAQKKLNYGPVIEFFSQAVITCWEESSATKSALMKLPSEWRARGGFRKNSAAERILETILARPILTVQMIKDILQISVPAANRAVEQLVTKKILRERTGFGRNRIFAAEEVIALLARPMTDTPEEALLRARLLFER